MYFVNIQTTFKYNMYVLKNDYFRPHLTYIIWLCMVVISIILNFNMRFLNKNFFQLYFFLIKELCIPGRSVSSIENLNSVSIHTKSWEYKQHRFANLFCCYKLVEFWTLRTQTSLAFYRSSYAMLYKIGPFQTATYNNRSVRANMVVFVNIQFTVIQVFIHEFVAFARFAMCDLYVLPAIILN